MKQVVFDVLAFPINPADVSFCKGSYLTHAQRGERSGKILVAPNGPV